MFLYLRVYVFRCQAAFVYLSVYSYVSVCIWVCFAVCICASGCATVKWSAWECATLFVSQWVYVGPCMDGGLSLRVHLQLFPSDHGQELCARILTPPPASRRP